MKPERWQHISELFDAALKLAPGQRTAFLEQACAGNELLRREVESLIDSYRQAGAFIESPALAEAAEMFPDSQGEPLVRQVIGRYRIIKLLGAGGMGEVYLAQDLTLGRQVALKLLPVYFTEDADRLRRFEQEARAASALNHPNIVTIYEIGHAGSNHYIATEFIDGVTLRQHMAETHLEVGKAIDTAAQIASALAAAHAKGIVHRDIKSDNIMVQRYKHLMQREHQVKVLDFGLAKLIEPEASRTNSQAPTRPLVNTYQGILMGTAPYMSPEQARGETVDARTDIWSLGVVVYEMLTGGLPFEGATPEDVRAAILKDRLRPIAAEVPDRLRWIVEKALRKDREERYQSVRELFSDLRELQNHEQKLVSESLRLEALASSGGVMTGDSAGQSPGNTPYNPEALTSGARAARQTSTTKYLVGEVKQHKRAAALAVIALTFFLAGFAFGLYKFFIHDGSIINTTVPFQNSKVTRLTTTGNVRAATISPDGKLVAYMLNASLRESLWLKQVATNSNVQIALPSDLQDGKAENSGLTFSRDGNYIFLVSGQATGGSLYRMPVFGGVAKKIIEDVDTPVTLSPDDKRLAFVRYYPIPGETSLIVANADGTGEQRLATRKDDGFPLEGPVWSPDGKVIACAAKNSHGGDSYVTVVGVRVEDGAEKAFTSKRWAKVGRLAWLLDGSGLVMPAMDQGSAPFNQIWHLSYPKGEARRITNDLNDYGDVSLTGDSGSLVTVLSDQRSNIWIAPNGDSARAAQVSSNNSDGTEGIFWAPDGKIVYTSNVSGNEDLWIMKADGSGPKQLTADAGRNFAPSVSPDGRHILFLSDRARTVNLWRMEIDGTNPRQLLTGSDGGRPSYSPDGRWIIYIGSNSSGVGTIWKVSVDGGAPVQLTDSQSGKPAVSPDGTQIACGYFDEQTGWRIALVPFEGGKPTRMFDIPANMTYAGGIGRWTRDGRALTYIDTRGGVSNIWKLPLDGSPPQQLTDFKADRIFWFDWSHDGQRLALARGTVTSDVVMIKDFR